MHGVLPRPQSRQSLELGPIVSVQHANLRLHTHVNVGVSQQTLNTNENLGYRQRQAPVVVDRVEADVTVTTDVRVKYLGDEAHNRWSHRVPASDTQTRRNQMMTHSTTQFSMLTNSRSFALMQYFRNWNMHVYLLYNTYMFRKQIVWPLKSRHTILYVAVYQMGHNSTHTCITVINIKAQSQSSWYY